MSRPCPFCGSPVTAKVSDFATSLMVASYHCADCNSYFEAIKWGDASASLDVPPFLAEAADAPHEPDPLPDTRRATHL